MRPVKLLLLISIALIINVSAKGQVKASFIPDATKGCGTTVIGFKSTSSNYDSIRWYLGTNGITIKDSIHTAASYAPGSYTVKLVAYNHATTPKSDSSSVVISIYNPPVAAFTVDYLKACVPFTANFTDHSVKGDGNINAWYWDFGEGVTKTAQNTPYTFTTTGNKSIYLKVTDTNGCIASKTETNYIDVADAPVAGFTPSPAGGCTAPLNVTFYNNSTGPGNVTYSWNFGNGLTSTQVQPNTTYSTTGSYQVVLAVSSSNYHGCSSTITVPSAVTIGNAHAIGTLKQNGLPISNGIVCAGTGVDFASTSTGASTVYWDFGDNNPIYNNNGSYMFTDAGTYTIKLVASSNSQCSDTLKWNITVESVTSSFSILPGSSCSSSPVTVAMNNISSANAVTYYWTFADGTHSSLKNPPYTFTPIHNTDPYAINNPITYFTTLDVTSLHNCKSSFTNDFTINRPTARFSIDSTQGCFPLKVKFKDQSYSDASITFFRWQCGDGKDTTTIVDSLAHTYSNAGVYQARLIITNQFNCLDTSYYLTIKVGKKPNPDFSVVPSAICASTVVQFTDLTPAADNVDYWQYTLNGRSLPVFPMVPSPSLKLHTDTGTVNVTLITGSQGCYAQKTKTIKNDGPVDSIKYSVDCLTPLKYNFTAKAMGVTSYSWDFGDGQINTSTLTPVHTYATVGDKTVKFIGYGPSCSDTVIQIVKVRQKGISFTSAKKVCAGGTLQFIATESSTDGECRDKYIWDFADGTASVRTGLDTIYHKFPNRDTCKVLLTAIFDNGCTDTISKSIKVYSPFAKFNTDKSAGCNPLQVNFLDKSVPDVNTIKQWDWDFGDGNTASYPTSGSTPADLYMNDGTYKVVLTVTDTMNCVDTISHLISIVTPYATFSTDAQVYCSSTSVKFSYDFPNPDSVRWDFGDGNISKNKTNPLPHTYLPVNAESYYTVKLIVYKYGCASPEFSMNNGFEVQKASAKFLCDTVINCANDQVHFDNSQGALPGISGSWDFGDGQSSPTYSSTADHHYANPGIYTVTLNIQTSNGCKDKYSKSILVKGPKGDFTLSKSNVCKGDIITAHLKDTLNIQSYVWVPGDGNFGYVDPWNFKYTSVGVKDFTLSLTGTGAIPCKIPITKTINVENVSAAFSLSDTLFCDQISEAFTNLSIGANNLYLWDFGDGKTSSSFLPDNRIYTAGNYTISLAVESTSPVCKDTARKSIVVNPSPNLTLGIDKSLCSSGKLILKAASNGNTLIWTPSAGLDQTDIYNVKASPARTTVYKVISSYSATNCSKADSFRVSIPYANISPTDTSIVIDTDLTLVLKDSSDIKSFQWLPPQLADLSCTNCLNPTIKPANMINSYNVILQEPNGCFSDTIRILVKIDTTHQVFALPSAFKPGASGVNGYFRPQGRGIYKIIEFKIYNRWGNVVYSSTDLEPGWDGTFNGKDQPLDTYIYTITVQTHDQRIWKKKGAVLLLR